jgi:hypothetical protein
VDGSSLSDSDSAFFLLGVAGFLVSSAGFAFFFGASFLGDFFTFSSTSSAEDASLTSSSLDGGVTSFSGTFSLVSVLAVSVLTS